MAQQIKQNGVALMTSPENTSCSIIFGNLTGVNFSKDEREQYKNYLSMMFHDFPKMTYGVIELWEDGKFKQKGNISK